MWDTKQTQDSTKVFSMTIPIIEQQLNGQILKQLAIKLKYSEVNPDE